MAKRASSRAVRPNPGEWQVTPYNHFTHAVEQASAQATVEEKVETLLEAITDPNRGIGRKGLNRSALRYYLRKGTTDKAGVSAEQWGIVTDVYSKHVEPYFMTGTQEEREAFARSLAWLFRPEEIMAYGLRTGCGSTAPVFAVLARMARLSARLAISVRADDFPAACPNPGQPRLPDVRMNGHQIVMVKQDSGQWGGLNSSVGTAHISTPEHWWATDLGGNKLEWNKPEDAVDTWVKYPGRSVEYVIRAVESMRYDLLLVQNAYTCKNVQASGSHNIEIVRALPPRP